MPIAYYMSFTPGHHGALDRIGGLPTHLPAEYPVSQLTGKPLGFVGQFVCHPERLPVEAFLVQVYLPVDDDDTEFVRALVLPHDAPLNTGGAGTVLANSLPHDISWYVADDPPEPLSDEQMWEVKVFQSKARGTCAFFDILDEGEEFLLQLDELPGKFNFGSYNCVLIKRADGAVYARLA